jgi:hypothetical protein
MKELKIDDSASITDKIGKVARGVVTMRTLDGKIVFSKENMITKAGRKIILDSLTNDKVFYSLSEVHIGSDNKIEDGETTTINTDPTKGIIISKGTIDSDHTKLASSGTAAFTESIDTTNIAIKIQIFIAVADPTNNFTASELGLVFSDGTEANDILFSRVVFDPVAISTTEKYLVDYTLYF